MSYNPPNMYNAGVPSAFGAPQAEEGPRQIFDKAQLTQWVGTSEPLALRCATCNQVVSSKVKFEIGGGNHAAAFLTCMTGGWAGCCLIPYCFDDCKDAVHTCPTCNNVLAKRFII
eukprot:TRINITY_DN964_c0_g2_i1.p2 TRINITY_DN964_c0_g2~~TRINITY_DN964_c0_g2_i1.p2  ORF type:complete len:115 (+),score=25.76 TRINITY_DN964_c0_g2_i1:134-478(+)